MDVEWLSTAEAGRRLGLSARTIYAFINSGELTAYRFGRVIRIREEDLAAFVTRCRVVPGTLSAQRPPDRS